MQRLAGLDLRFRRFTQDALAVACLAGSVLGLLATWGLTGGTVLTPVSRLISVWLGWGYYLAIVGAILLGVRLVRHRENPIRWGLVLPLEFAALLSLGLLSIFGSNSLVRADAGLDGGRLGWGIAFLLARLVGETGAGITFGVAIAACVAVATGSFSILERWILHLAGEPADAMPVRADVEPADAEDPAGSVEPTEMMTRVSLDLERMRPLIAQRCALSGWKKSG